jgi:hypothetical protein
VLNVLDTAIIVIDNLGRGMLEKGCKRGHRRWIATRRVLDAPAKYWVDRMTRLSRRNLAVTWPRP